MSEQQKREYSGQALNTVVLGLSHSQAIVDKVLADAGVERIDPEAWYDFDWAGRIFTKLEEVLGAAVVKECGRKMIESAEYPPEIDSVAALLPGLGPWYALHARGPGVGTITCEIEDEHSAILDWSTPGFTCAFCVGILEGACERYGVKPLIEHGAGGCRDDGAPTCIYHVSW
ncbi:hypothetical protein G6O69_35330 [Pseudenhygromyxa sp. WMMC2535]|uniref:hypothetical protein n=1 Tax=Pseudenhygromyxa sp. WMMC2535 TaxID=2712867 RepID=UPI001553E9F8|nr:hypothetical protein [Pseudenhygromyxa sp. WMMC2535]NVB43150.1 hypothetical protein [Pseudenhygromyxa sp. WMMC2535]